MGGLRAWVWVAESMRRARTTEVFILRTNRPLIHSSIFQPYLYPSTIIKVKIQFSVKSLSSVETRTRKSIGILYVADKCFFAKTVQENEIRRHDIDFAAL